MVKEGRVPGTMDVDLRVDDKSPWSASVGLNNDYSADTSKLRGMVTLGHDNLWQSGHTFSLTYFTAPRDMQGKSFRPVFFGETPADWRDSFFYQHYGEWVAPHYGVRTDRYKLIYFYNDPDHPEWELFDLKNDPKELSNVYNNPEYASVVKEMHKKLLAVQEECGYTKEVDDGVMMRWRKRLADKKRWEKNK